MNRRAVWSVVGVSALLFLTGCGSVGLGVTIPVGSHGGVGVSVGSGGRIGVGVGATVGGGQVGGQVGVGTSFPLPKKPEPPVNGEDKAGQTESQAQ